MRRVRITENHAPAFMAVVAGLIAAGAWWDSGYKWTAIGTLAAVALLLGALAVNCTDDGKG